MYNTNMSRTQIIFVKNTTQNKKSMIEPEFDIFLR